jgi:hypothetical protein
MNKKIYFIIPFLALILIFSFALAACSGGSEASSTTKENEEATQESEEPEIIENVAEDEIVEETITKEGTPEEENTEEAEFVSNFMKARLEKDQLLAESFLTDNAKTSTLGQD